MAKIDFETLCPCGHKLKGQMKKPTLIERSVAAIKCRRCSSRFLMVSQRKRGDQGRLILTEVEIIEVTEMARNIVKAKMPNPVVEKAAKILGIAKPDTSKSIVETEMDTPAE